MTPRYVCVSINKIFTLRLDHILTVMLMKVSDLVIYEYHLLYFLHTEQSLVIGE